MNEKPASLPDAAQTRLCRRSFFSQTLGAALAFAALIPALASAKTKSKKHKKKNKKSKNVVSPVPPTPAAGGAAGGSVPRRAGAGGR